MGQLVTNNLLAPFRPQYRVSHWAGVTPIKAAWRMNRGRRTGNRI